MNQRLEALAKANVVRSEIAELKRALKTGEADLLDVIASERSPLTCWQALTATQGVGPAKARQALRRAQVEPNRRLRDAQGWERERLIEALLTLRRFRNLDPEDYPQTGQGEEPLER